MKRFHILLVIILIAIFRCSCYGQYYSDNDTVLARSYKNIADSMMHIHEYDSAAFYFEKSAEVYRKIEHWNYLCYAEIWESYAYEDMGNYDKALSNLDSAIVYFNRHLPSDNAESFRCSTIKARVYYTKNDYITGLEILRDAYILFHRNPEFNSPENQKHLAKALFQYGSNCLQLGMIDTARMKYTEAYQIAVKHYPENHSFLIDIYNCLGIVYAFNQDIESAIIYTTKGLNGRLEHYGFAHPMTAWSYTNLGLLYLGIGEFDKALNYYFKGLESRKQCLPPDHVELGSSYSVIASAYNETGDYEKALEYHHKALEIFTNKFGENDIEVSSVYNNIADAYNKQHNYRKALNYFKKALDIANKTYPDTYIPQKVVYTFNIADTYVNLNEIDSALVYNTSSIEANFSRANETNNPDEILDLRIAMYTLEQKAGLHLSKFKTTGLHEEVQAAFDVYNKCYELLDYMRTGSTGQESKILLTQLNSEIMNGIINTAYLLYAQHPDSASTSIILRFIEKNKASVLEEMILRTVKIPETELPDSLLTRWKNLSGKIFTLNTEKMLLTRKEETQKLKETENQLFMLQKDLNELNDFLRMNYAGYTQATSNLATMQFSDFHPTNNETVILSYYMSDSALFIHALDRENSYLRVVSVDSSLEEEVALYLKSIKKTRIEDFKKRSTELYNIMISPVEDIIKNHKQLVIIPDKYLYYLPFESLCKQWASDQLTSAEYLINHFEVIYHYSITLYRQSMEKDKRKKPTSPSFAGFAPVFSSGSTYSLVNNDSYTSILDSTFHNSPEIMRSISFDGKTYNELPYSEIEVHSIAEMFRKNGYPTKEFLHSRASEDEFKEVIPTYKYIHLASHGIINENHPELSGIIFSQSENYKETASYEDSTIFRSKGKTENTEGILFSGEMYALHMNADLVVLSACETGLGKVIKGEGLMSMTRGFIYSGTPNILFTLWKIDDKNTSELMIDFYRNILDGDSYSEALRKSKLKFILKEETSFPRYWSGFTLIGIK